MTTAEITTITNAFKEDTTTKVDTKHLLPSLPRVRHEKATLYDGTSGWKKTSTIVHPEGKREITAEHPDGEREVWIEESPKAPPSVDDGSGRAAAGSACDRRDQKAHRSRTRSRTNGASRRVTAAAAAVRA